MSAPLSDARAVEYRHGCYRTIAVLTVMVAASAWALWRFDERFNLPIVVIAVIMLAVCGPLLLGAIFMWLYSRTDPSWSTDFTGEVLRRPELLAAFAPALQDGRYERTGSLGAVAGVQDGLPVTVWGWVEPRRSPPQGDVLVITVGYPWRWRARVGRHAADPDEGRPVDTAWVEGAIPPPMEAVREQQVLRAFHELGLSELELTPEGLSATLPANRHQLARDRLQRTIAELLRLTRAFAGVEVSAAPVRSALTCPFCRAGIEPAAAASCSVCDTPHHRACLLEHGGCTVLGCANGPRARRRERA